MTIPYTKMQGAGNDFIVIDNRTLKFSHEQLSQFAAQVCHRKFSVGADAVMAVDFPTGTADFRMRFYNADGKKQKCAATALAVLPVMPLRRELLASR